MLQRLIIRNYAIIDELVIDYDGRLNMVTGETGAGKSIVMGALQLILGERADSSALQAEKKCVVEGVFTGGDSEAIAEFLRTNDLDASEEWVLRREITPAGKSRSFINDTPVNLSQLKSMATLLVDLHQQFDTRELEEEDFQRRVLDCLAGNGGHLRDLAGVFDRYAVSRNRLERLKEEKLRAERELDYNRFLYDELSALGLKQNELEDLESESKMLDHAQTIKDDIRFIHHHLSGGSDMIVQQLRMILGRFDHVAGMIPAAADLQKRLQSSLIEIRDIDEEVGRLAQSVNHNPAKLQQIHDRLSEGYRLLKKHGFQLTAQLLELQAELHKKISVAEGMAFDIQKAEAETGSLQQEAMTIAERISENRKKQLKSFTAHVNELLHKVGMPHAGIKVDITSCELNRSGTDKVDFLFQANLSKKGEQQYLPLGKVASGGELSRLMLCVKSLVAESMQMPTLIFDEIDSGISGEAARQVGAMLKKLSASHQVISITHQPQVAARADAHYFVYKEMKDGRVLTNIRKLDTEGRVTAIARMLGGEKPTAAAMANAREMVEHP